MTNCWSRPGTLSGIITLTGRNGKTRSPITYKEEIRLVWQSVTICLKTTVAWRKWSILCQKTTPCYRLVHGKNSLFHVMVSFWIYNVREITIRLSTFPFHCECNPSQRTNNNISKSLQILIEMNIAFLQEIAGMFSAVGMCEQAVTAFTKVSPILTTLRIIEISIVCVCMVRRETSIRLNLFRRIVLYFKSGNKRQLAIILWLLLRN